MYSRAFLVFTIIILFLLMSCNIFEPDNEKGSLFIEISSETTFSLSGTPEIISSVHCLVSKGSRELYDQEHTKAEEGKFSISVDDLEPADNYSVLLYGKNSQQDIIGRAYQEDIRIIARVESQISMTWTGMQPVLLTPADSSFLSNDTPSFTWSGVSSAACYELQVGLSSNFTAPVIDQSSLTSTDYTPPLTLSPTTYFWRVRCRDNQANWGEWSDTWSFTINTQGLAAPTLSSPADGSTITDTTPSFTWSAVSAASYYQLQIDSSDNFSSPVIDQSNLTSPGYTTASILSDNTYYWRVRCQDSEENWGAWSDTWDFTINTQGLAAPILSSPADGSTITDTTPSFAWSAVSNASYYQLQVDSSDSFSSPVLDHSDLTSHGFTAASMLSDNTYYWRVRCQDSQKNWGEWSDVWSFIISTPSITVTSPNGEESWELGSNQAITWTSSNAGSEVKITLYKGNNLYATLAGSTPNNSSYNWSIPSNYDVDSNYTLKITSVSDTNIFDYSDSNFTLYTTNYVKIYGVCFVYFGPDNTLHIGDVTMTFTSEMGAAMATVTNYPYGHYEQEVPYGWSGSLSASKLGFDFTCDFQGSRQSEYHFENITQDTKVDFWDNRCTDSTATPILVDSTGTLTDIDGNTYKTIKIGDQWWMAENLKVSHYRNGDPITHITNQGEWHTIYLHYGAYCAYGNDESNADTYGYLYNWVAVHDNRHIAPEGWHVPSYSEWRKLEMFLGMSEAESKDDWWRGTTEGSKLKSRSGWHNEGNGTDEVGFTALPAGYRGTGGNFENLGRNTSFWTATQGIESTALIRKLDWDRSDIFSIDTNKRYGYSVRLVKD